MSVVQPYPSFHPKFQHQGPACNCKIDGKCLGWLSCSAYGMAMLIDRATLGSKRPTGCQVRARVSPRDLTGGLTMKQVAQAAKDGWGVVIDVRVGSNTISPNNAAIRLYNGMAFGLQGNTRALLDTKWRSTSGSVNHFVSIIDGRDWYRNASGVLLPREALVYDPAADGRYSYDQGPSWWPWSLVNKFASYLRPWGDNDPRILGGGKMYAGFTRDTEPYVILRYGATKSTPFPDGVKAAANNVNVRLTPNHITGKVVRTLDLGEPFTAWQKTSGTEFQGSRLWMGNRTGTEWVHSKVVTGENA